MVFNAIILADGVDAVDEMYSVDNIGLGCVVDACMIGTTIHFDEDELEAELEELERAELAEQLL